MKNMQAALKWWSIVITSSILLISDSVSERIIVVLEPG
jgi:hypothetical protein